MHVYFITLNHKHVHVQFIIRHLGCAYKVYPFNSNNFSDIFIVNQKYCLNCQVRIHYIRITEKLKIHNISDYKVVPHQLIIVVMNSMHSTIIRNGMFIPKIELC